MAADEPIRVLHIMTVPMSLLFVKGQASYMRERGIEIHVLTSPGEFLGEFGSQENVKIHAVEMARRITPFLDLRAIVQLIREIRSIRPHIVHARTPKASLLGMIAAWMTGIPIRIYHIHGFPFMTARGSRRFLLRLSERISCLLSSRVLSVSDSIAEVAVHEGFCARTKLGVLHHGSVNGVDAIAQFNPDLFSSNQRAKNRAELGIPQSALVIGFVGRIVRDKGIAELAQAWQTIRNDFPNSMLVMIGPFEPEDPIPASIIEALQCDERVCIIDWGRDMPFFYSVMDMVILPTYREGFPSVPLEAAAMRLPVVATRIPGCTDAVEDTITGTLVPVGDANELVSAIRMYLSDSDLRSKHGSAGRERILRDFGQEAIWEATYCEYMELLDKRPS